MAKVIIEILDTKIAPNAESKINIEIKFEPAKKYPDSKAQQLGMYLINCIDDFRASQSGKITKATRNKY